MATYEFRLAGEDAPLGTKDLEVAPQPDEDVAIEGIIYRVDAPPENPRGDPTVIYVRRAGGI